MEELKNVVRARLSLPPNLRIDQVLLSDVGAVVDHPDQLDNNDRIEITVKCEVELHSQLVVNNPVAGQKRPFRFAEPKKKGRKKKFELDLLNNKFRTWTKHAADRVPGDEQKQPAKDDSFNNPSTGDSSNIFNIFTLSEDVIQQVPAPPVPIEQYTKHTD